MEREEVKNDILLIQPKNLLATNNYPPLGLISIGTVLEKEGYKVDILPTSRFSNWKDIIRENIDRYLFIGVTVLTTEVIHAIELTKFVKKLKPNLPIVWGGWHVTLFPEQPIESGLVDYVVVGDGDKLVITLAEAIKNHTHLEPILRNKEHIDMNTLPEPNYSLVMDLESFIEDDLTDIFNKFINYKIRWLPYQSSRGCPHRCLFCINVVTDNTKYRTKSAEIVVNELENIQVKYDITHFKILDDNFFADIKRVKEICKLILERDLEFTWDVECRTDYFRKGFVDDSILSLLKKAGCVQFTMGIESGAQESLDKMCKDTTVEENENAIKKLHKHNIIPRLSFIVDIPGEKKEDIIKTQQFLNKIRQICGDKMEAGVVTYRPYPKSKFHDILVEDGLIEVPKTLEEWTKEYNVRLYGMYDNKKPWQKNYKLSTNVAFFNTQDTDLREHQLNRKLDKLFYRIFIRIFRIRTDKMIYVFPMDRLVYTFWRDNYYKRRESLYKTIDKSAYKGILGPKTQGV